MRDPRRGRRKPRPRKSVQRHAAVDPHSALVPPGYDHVDTMTERQLHERLVLDATLGVATPLAWCVLAYDRIGKLSGKGPEEAYQRVRKEALVVSYGMGMPMA